jgi:hypothetical protein
MCCGCSGRPEGKNRTAVLAAYNRALGRPTAQQRDALQKACKDIYKVQTWPELFKRINVMVPPNSFLATLLRDAIRNSAQKGYHRGRRGGGSSAGGGGGYRGGSNRGGFRGGYRGSSGGRR